VLEPGRVAQRGLSTGRLEPYGHHPSAVLLLRRILSLGSVQRACSPAGPGLVLMPCLYLSQKSISCVRDGEDHHPSLPDFSYLLSQRGSRKVT